VDRSPLDLSTGWWPRPRGLTSWPLYQSLGALGRRLVEVLLERAQWAPRTVWVAGRRVDLAVGQLIDGEEELARLCGRGVSRKVVRTALGRLAAGGFLDRRPALPMGQCPYVITVRDYASLLLDGTEGGQRPGQPMGHAGASKGPGEGQAGAPLEQEEHLNTGTTTLPPPPAPAAGKRRLSSEKAPDPRHRPLLQLLEATFLDLRGTPYGHQGGRDGKALAELLRLSGGDAGEVDRRWRRALELGAKWPGCGTIAALPGRWNELAAANRSRGMAPPSTDWPTEEREVNLVEPEVWIKLLAVHDALPPEQRWPAVREMRAMDDGQGGLLLLCSPERAAGLKAMGKEAWLSSLAGGASVRFKARPPGAGKRTRGMATPSTDWTSKEATEL
jgi:hypothetical protein